MKVYERTENGATTHVSRETGLAEINDAMIGPAKRTVQTMSSITRTDYAIEYRGGRSVRLVLVEADQDAPLYPPTEMEAVRLRAERQAERRTQNAPEPEGFGAGQAVIVERPGRAPRTGTVAHIHTAPGYVAVEDFRTRSVSNYPTRFVSAAPEVVEEEPAEIVEDEVQWTVASHRRLLHKFTEASANGRAACNKSFRPHRYGNGYDFRTRAEHEADQYAYQYTFCPKCESK